MQENHVVFGADGTWLTTRRIDGQFPNYRQLLPEQFEHELAAAARGAARRRSPRVADGAAQLAAAAALRRGRADRLGAARRTSARRASRCRRRSPPTRWRSASTPSSCATGSSRSTRETVTFKLISPLRPAVLEGERRRLHVPDHADPARRLSRRARHASDIPLVRVARPRTRRRESSWWSDGTAPARRTCSSRCTSATQGFSPRTRHGRAADPLRRDGCARGRRGNAQRRAARARGDAAPGPGEGGARERREARRPPSRCGASSRRSSSRPTGWRSSRAGRLRGARTSTACSAGSSRRAPVPQDYLAALAQRNAALRRVQLGVSDRARARAVDRAGRRRSAQISSRRVARRSRRSRPGSPSARRSSDCRRRGSATTPSRRRAEALESRLARDLERGTTGLGPHLDDVLIASGDRDLRQFGSQGEQRLAVLSLLLAEAELLPTPPLLLLDDVLSELDPGRRQVLAERVAGWGRR